MRLWAPCRTRRISLASKGRLNRRFMPFASACRSSSAFVATARATAFLLEGLRRSAFSIWIGLGAVSKSTRIPSNLARPSSSTIPSFPSRTHFDSKFPAHCRKGGDQKRIGRHEERLNCTRFHFTLHSTALQGNQRWGGTSLQGRSTQRLCSNVRTNDTSVTSKATS